MNLWIAAMAALAPALLSPDGGRRRKVLLAMADSAFPAGALACGDMAGRAALVVESRIDGMAFPMRIALGILLKLFDWSAVASCGCRFAEASRSARRRHESMACRWKPIPFAELLRLVRTLSLMVCYDDPGMRRSLTYTEPEAQR